MKPTRKFIVAFLHVEDSLHRLGIIETGETSVPGVDTLTAEFPVFGALDAERKAALMSAAWDLFCLCENEPVAWDTERQNAGTVSVERVFDGRTPTADLEPR